MIYIYSYCNKSKSANLLRDGFNKLGVPSVLINHVNSRFRGNPDKTVINWGASKLPYEVMCARILNHPKRVARAVDKVRFFEHSELTDTYNTPEYTTDKGVAEEWIDAGKTVVGRHLIKGHASKGIVLYTPNDQLDEAPLYTLYRKKKREFRVHVMNNLDEALVQEKKRKFNVNINGKDFMVCDPEKFAFCNTDGKLNPAFRVRLVQVARSVINHMGLDFGGVDIGYNQFHNDFTVYEVNTAPGIDGSDIRWYCDNLLKI